MDLNSGVPSVHVPSVHVPMGYYYQGAINIYYYIHLQPSVLCLCIEVHIAIMHTCTMYACI